RLDELVRQIHLVELDERLADFVAHRLVERARHRATDEQRVNLRKQLAYDVDLARYLGAAEYRDKRAPGIGECAAEVVQLLLHEQSGAGGVYILRDAGGGCVGTMRRAERVVHEHVAELRQGARETV